ncbi:MAG: hypothetical protein OXQ84_20340 [bacterium]|nr:hypothetical protein [bacterium]
MAGLAQHRLHHTSPSEVVGIDVEGQFGEQVCAAQLVPTLVADEVRYPAVVDQAADVAGDDAGNDIFGLRHVVEAVEPAPKLESARSGHG